MRASDQHTEPVQTVEETIHDIPALDSETDAGLQSTEQHEGNGLSWQQALALLDEINKRLPVYLLGIERLDMIARIMASFSHEHRQILRLFMTRILYELRRLEGSDVDLGSHGAMGKIWFRIHGDKQPVDSLPPLPAPHADIFIMGLLTENQRKLLLKTRSLDFSYETHFNSSRQRYRATAYFDLEALALNMRAINATVLPFNSYGFHPSVARMMSLEHTKEGLILITGITGSGKSTTLDAIIDMNNRRTQSHIIIIGAPIEYIHTPMRSIIRHREVGLDVLSFKEGTVQALRQDPDIVVIGEMRDPETIMAALEITDSGHKVFSTLHTSSAVESIDRIVAECPVNEQERVRLRLADVLRIIVSQKLLPSTDGKRILATEIVNVTAPVKAAIKNGNTGEIYQMITEGRQYGMHTMEQDLRRLVKKHLIRPEDAMNYANNKKRMHQLLNTKNLIREA